MSVFTLLADILFVGHSLVGPDLPPMVQAGLRLMGQEQTVAAQIINGAPLKFQLENGATAEGVDARAELAKGDTDVLILTEAIPLAAQIQWNDTPAQVAAYATLARAANPSVQVYLYETWHSLKSGQGTVIGGDTGASVPWRDRIDADLALWEGIAQQATARPTGAPVRIVPAGQALGKLADAIAAGEVPEIASITDLFTDDIHLNHKGLYFVALVHLSTITGRTPMGLPAKLTRNWPSRDAVISDATAAVLQRIAWKAVVDYRNQVAAAPETARRVAAPVEMAFTPVTNPNLAIGLSGVNDWSVQQPFLNIMKTARSWTGHVPGQWGGWDHDRLAAGGYLDAQGWPTAIPPEITGVTTLILTDLPENAGGVAGRYVLTHAGDGDLKLEGRASNVTINGNTMEFDYAPGPGGVLITITRTNPANPIRNIVVVRQDRAADLAAGQIFNPDWLARIQGVRGIRFMDWMLTNDSTLASVADRPKPDDYTYARVGVPVEIMVALANELNADPWFTIPHLANDALVKGYADATFAGLKPDLQAHVEYSNEVWNWQFAQANWAEVQGKARWGKDQTWVQFYALRASQVADIWAGVYGAQADARLVRVIATQTGWIGLEDQILNAPLVVAETGKPPHAHFDAYAVTGYFSALLGADTKTPAIRDWLAQSETDAATRAANLGLNGTAAANYISDHRYDLAISLAATELHDGSVTGDSSDSLAKVLDEVLPYQASVARRHGLQLVMYEGGTHVVGYGAEMDDAAVTGFFHHLNYSPEMAALYAELMQGWAGLTDAPFNAFVDISTPTKYGSWGAMRHLTDDNPRWQALAKGCAAC